MEFQHSGARDSDLLALGGGFQRFILSSITSIPQLSTHVGSPIQNMRQKVPNLRANFHILEIEVRTWNPDAPRPDVAPTAQTSNI